jgi:hypothetical protein
MYYCHGNCEWGQTGGKSTRVACYITLAVGKEVNSIAELLVRVWQDALVSIPLRNDLAESIRPGGRTTRHACCPVDVRIHREHPSLLLVAGVIVEKGWVHWEVIIVFHNIRQVVAERKVTFRFCSNDDSDGVADPFVWPLWEVEGFEGF